MSDDTEDISEKRLRPLNGKKYTNPTLSTGRLQFYIL